jgi:hypothetical protein
VDERLEVCVVVLAQQRARDSVGRQVFAGHDDGGEVFVAFFGEVQEAAERLELSLRGEAKLLFEQQ